MKPKTTIRILVAAALLAGALYYTVFYWAIPKTAAWTFPFKWRNLPMRAHRTIARSYLGHPADTMALISDRWYQGPVGKQYSLTLYYNRDTLVRSAAVYYHYRSWLKHKDYLIDSVTTE